MRVTPIQVSLGQTPDQISSGIGTKYQFGDILQSCQKSTWELDLVIGVVRFCAKDVDNRILTHNISSLLFYICLVQRNRTMYFVPMIFYRFSNGSMNNTNPHSHDKCVYCDLNEGMFRFCFVHVGGTRQHRHLLRFPESIASISIGHTYGMIGGGVHQEYHPNWFLHTRY